MRGPSTWLCSCLAGYKTGSALAPSRLRASVTRAAPPPGLTFESRGWTQPRWGPRVDEWLEAAPANACTSCLLSGVLPEEWSLSPGPSRQCFLRVQLIVGDTSNDSMPLRGTALGDARVAGCERCVFVLVRCYIRNRACGPQMFVLLGSSYVLQCGAAAINKVWANGRPGSGIQHRRFTAAGSSMQIIPLCMPHGFSST